MSKEVAGRDLVCDAVLYGVGATLRELAKTEVGARFTEELHKAVGRYMAEYLREKQITYQIEASPEETVKSILGMFVERLDFAERVGKGPSSSIDFRAGSAEVVVPPHSWTPRENVGSGNTWVTLDAPWGKRLGAQRNGKLYRLSRGEFVRKMAELSHSSLDADPQRQAIAGAYQRQTVHSLRFLGALAPRRADFGPQGLPVNKSAASARVLASAADPAYMLSVRGRVRNPLTLSLEQLRGLPQREARLPIACVEGWSASAMWRGIGVRDLLAMAGAAPEAEVEVWSMQPGGQFKSSVLNGLHAKDPNTLLALELNGEPLHLDHGFPVRLIGPNRPGVMQTKWVSQVVVR
jgi:hypothetical protein